MQFINCTPHPIVLNDGRSFQPSGDVPRVANTFSDPDADGVMTCGYGAVEGLPAPQDGVLLVVSALVLAACPDRSDLVAPATGHPDVVRDGGRIVSVPGFIRLS